ncbi:MAG: right-handed parallel beta-helix repeat-containing protein [Bdellovibrionales bacterium]|nr:right-handed parallel beta-helix repeat-containing protein [Bdellovibrionales bacterium]
MPSAIRVIFDGGALVCDDLAGGTPAEVGRRLQSCFDRADAYGVIELLPGVHLVSQALHIQKPVRIVTQGLDEASPPCADNVDKHCAVIRAVSPMANISRSFLRITSNEVELDRIVIDGNKDQRYSSPEADGCLRGDNGYGMNISATSNFLSLVGMTSTNALCGTGVEIGGGLNLLVQDSYFTANGVHNVQNLWSDGLTVGSAINATITGNYFRDNTDVDLIFGGCTNCNISGNTVKHSASFASSTFAAMMFHAWPGGPGDYTGSTITGNKVDCANFRCGFGFMIGASPWYQATTKGGLYFDNQITGAQVGILINDATDVNVPIQIGPNNVSNCGGNFLSSAGPVTAAALVISPGSIRNVQFVQGASISEYSVMNFKGAILNWWTQDVAPPPPPASVCDANHPAPSWGGKDGQCLASCGGLGGTSAFADACSNHGKVDAGRAYDVPFCCKDPAPVSPPPPPPPPPPTSVCDANHTAPHWGVKGGQCLASCGGLGGTSAFADACSNHGKVDAGRAYDVPFCCKDPAPVSPPPPPPPPPPPTSVCDANHPAPHWGVKGGQCLASCGGIGGTSAFADACSNHGKVDAGRAYDVPFCCK